MLSLKKTSKPLSGSNHDKTSSPYHKNTKRNGLLLEKEGRVLKSVISTLEHKNDQRRSRRRQLWKHFLCIGVAFIVLALLYSCIASQWRRIVEILQDSSLVHPTRSGTVRQRWSSSSASSSTFFADETAPTSIRPSLSLDHSHAPPHHRTGDGARFTERLMLSSVLHAFLEFPSLPHLQSLVRHSVQVSQFLLDQLPEAAGLENVTLTVREEQEKRKNKTQSTSSSRNPHRGDTKRDLTHPEEECRGEEEEGGASLSSSGSWEVEEWVGKAEVPLLLDSVAILYAVLQSVLLSMPPPLLPALSLDPPGTPSHRLGEEPLFPGILEESPSMVFQWVVATVFTLNHVLPEYFVRHTFGEREEAEAERAEAQQHAQHLSVLLQSINLEYWTQWQLLPSLLGNFSTVSLLVSRPSPTAICEHLLEGKEAGVKLSPASRDAYTFPIGVHRVCRHSFSSPASTARRIAANFEELIALHPRYGPFRLHYLSALRSWEAASLGSSHTPSSPPQNTSARHSRERFFEESTTFTPELVQKRRKMTERERSRSSTYAYTDAYHVPLLRWMELFTFSDADHPITQGNQKRSEVEEADGEERRERQKMDEGGGAQKELEEHHRAHASPHSSTFPLENMTSSLLDVLYALPHCRVLLQPGLFRGELREQKADRDASARHPRSPHKGLRHRDQPEVPLPDRKRPLQNSRAHQDRRQPTGDPSSWPGLALMPLVQRPPLFTIREVRSIMETKRSSLPPKEFESFMSC